MAGENGENPPPGMRLVFIREATLPALTSWLDHQCRGWSTGWVTSRTWLRVEGVGLMVRVTDEVTWLSLTDEVARQRLELHRLDLGMHLVMTRGELSIMDAGQQRPERQEAV